MEPVPTLERAYRALIAPEPFAAWHAGVRPSPGSAAIRVHAAESPDRRPYDRARDLAGLLPLWPSELADDTPAGRNRVVQKLRRALREERRRGLAGHWAYDLARHAALLRAYQHEVARLDAPRA